MIKTEDEPFSYDYFKFKNGVSSKNGKAYNIRRFCYRNVISLYKLIIISHTNNIMIENKYEYLSG